MTADYYPFTHEFLSETSTAIINNVRGINRVTYDITSKPPGTIEWELVMTKFIIIFKYQLVKLKKNV